MIGKNPRASAESLRSARPRLICRVDFKEDWTAEHTPYIREVESGCEEVTSEGYDPHHSPLGPVYWRIVNRGEERLYCSTFWATRDRVVKVWGTRGLAYCDTVTGLAVARIETNLLSAPKSDSVEDDVRLSAGANYRGTHPWHEN